MEKAEIFTHESPTLVYAMNWSVRPDKPFRLAVGSFVEDYANRVEVLQLDEERGVLAADPALAFAHPYPPTRLQFVPDREGSRPDLLASSGDAVRLWRLGADGAALERLLSGAAASEYCAPVTSFEWNDADPRRLAAASIDTTVTVWDVERGAVDAQLIAHDREVHDVCWGGAGVFASAGADGSVRVFDLRDREHSTIVYEGRGGGGGAPPPPLLRVAWNRQDPRYLAALALDSPAAAVLDIRSPAAPVAELARHGAPANAVAWAPHSAAHLCTAGDDCQALIWDVGALQAAPPGGGAAAAAARGVDPILAYNAGAEISTLAWSAAHTDWVAICFANKARILRI